MLGTSRHRLFQSVRTDRRYYQATSIIATPAVADTSERFTANATVQSCPVVLAVLRTLVQHVCLPTPVVSISLSSSCSALAATIGQLQVSPIPRDRRALSLYHVSHPSRSCPFSFRTSFLGASGTLFASVVYNPGRVSLVAVVSARCRSTLSRGSQLSHQTWLIRISRHLSTRKSSGIITYVLAGLVRSYTNYISLVG